MHRSYFWGVLFFVLLSVPAKAQSPRLINGTVVDQNDYKEVVKIRTGNSGCTATIVGPRTIITAAHCGKTGETAQFTVNGTSHSAVLTRSSLYPGQDHDISVGMTSSDIQGVKAATVGKTATTGLAITLLGYGCIKPGGGDSPDGKLRKGESTIVSFSSFDMVSKKSGGAALCFGDSGGPAFVIENGKRYLLGVNSKGNIQDTNYNTRTDMPESQTFLKKFAQENNVKICGVNSDCGTIDPPPAPACHLSASPSTLQLGQTLTLSIQTSGQVTSASIDGSQVNFPSGQKIFTPSAVGFQQALGSVSGPGGSGSCTASYTVEGTPPPLKPSCTITANPKSVLIGSPVTLTLTTQGEVNEGAIDGISVSVPIGNRVVRPTQEGTYQVWGSVMGPQGSAACKSEYFASKNPPIPPEAPNFTLVSTHCGANKLSTRIKQVCSAKIKRNSLLQSMQLEEAWVIIYDDQTRAVLPVIHKKLVSNAHRIKVEDLTLYANSGIKNGDYWMLDIRSAKLSSDALSATQSTPLKIEGRCSQGYYFMVDEMKAESSEEILHQD